MSVIELHNLTKEFGPITAVNGIDLEVEQGEVFGFLGPNGAGKSTTINILLDFMRPTDGRANVFGMDAQKASLPIRRRAGFLPEGYDMYDRLTGRQHIEFAVEAKRASVDVDELLDRVGMGDAGDRKVGGYSKGMQQRLALAITLIGEPDLLILDEPHSGLDPNGAREMLDIIHEENERGATILFSSHILEHVEAICDRVAILNRGEIVAINSVEGLRETLGATGEISFILDMIPDEAVDALHAIEGVESVTVGAERVTVTCPNESKAEVVETILRSDAIVRNIETRDMPLDDLFAAYTESGRDGTTAAEDSVAKRRPVPNTGGDDR